MPEYVTEKKRTICKECRWRPGWIMRTFDVTWLCRCPDVPREDSRVYGPGEQQTCSSINTGNCPHYEAKEK